MNRNRSNSFHSLSSADQSREVFGRCPTHWLIRQLSDRWTLQVLSLLQTSPRRFSELRGELRPVSPRMLGRTLKKLTQIGFVTQRKRGKPPMLYYELTELGRSVSKPVGRLLDWSLRNADRIEAMKASRHTR